MPLDWCSFVVHFYNTSCLKFQVQIFVWLMRHSRVFFLTKFNLTHKHLHVSLIIAYGSLEVLEWLE